MLPVERHDLSVAGCDVELASVAVGDTRAWTFALEAWGPDDTRHATLRTTLETFAAAAPLPNDFSRSIRSLSYPDWLAATVAATATPTSGTAVDPGPESLGPTA